MQTQTPCSDYRETKGLIYFARMLDKIRLKARGELPPDYFTGVDEDPTMFDARCTRFLGVNYDELVKRTLKGGSYQEILEWCFVRGRRPSEEEIAIWNGFISKRRTRGATHLPTSEIPQLPFDPRFSLLLNLRSASLKAQHPTDNNGAHRPANRLVPYRCP